MLIPKRLTKKYLRKRLLTEIWAGLREPTKHGEASRSRRHREILPLPGLKKQRTGTVLEKPNKNGCPVGGAAIRSCSHSDYSHRRMQPQPEPSREGCSQEGINP